ncbi:short chain dehydrogenase sol3 [Colletotrichum spaethianum]|uniref:Short chain dehydrogenase sol3 n=1 Tax=Colletotrichum spaethianum TaxID=700344 RepID=A0AA37PDA2_9PEZI|nr:short chain dehydrogenase sol3 [Colletotrichum spaethianum]GKT50067.1 short chain dehydrogenase sol3 [Colletotrichum spaethianum]
MAHALILGASGISGWSLLNQACSYPTPTTFKRITGTTNRPLTLEKAQLPNDPRLHIASGIDFTKSVDEVALSLKQKIPDADTISHVFYTAYATGTSPENTVELNTGLLSVAVQAIEKVSPNVKVVILQTGGKSYGVTHPNEVKICPPLKEDLPRIPSPWANDVFYYNQYDALEKLSEGKSWTFSEIRPDAIIGFAPTSNAMNLAKGIGIYLTIHRAVHGDGASVPFPGPDNSYYTTHSDTFQDILSKLEIHAAVNPTKCGDGRAFNAADGQTISWSQVWPRLCKYFGLKGQGPAPRLAPITDFVTRHEEVWAALASEHGLEKDAVQSFDWSFLDFMLVQVGFDREFDLTRSREVGFIEEIDTVEGFKTAWERMKAAKQLPPF